jgi:hypothetical protein
MTDETYQPDLRGVARNVVSRRIAKWKPDVME